MTKICTTNGLRRAMLLACPVITAAMSVAFSSAPAMAQEAPAAERATLEEIIVTARKREENLLDVPATISAMTGSEMEDKGFQSLRDYSAFVPGFVFSGSALAGERSGPDITIRGVANSRLIDFETSIATSTTGFVYGNMPAYSFDPSILDIERVEVLKGPQGTLYGASSMGGTLKVIPQLPKADELTATVIGGISLTNSGGNNYKVGAVVNVPLVKDVLALRFSALSREDSGFIDATIVRGIPTETRGRDTTVVGFNPAEQTVFGGPGRSVRFAKNIDGEHLFSGRVALRFTPDDKFDATLAYFYQSKSIDSYRNIEPAIATRNNKYLTEIYQLQPESTNYQLASLDLNYDLGSVSLHSVTGWLRRKYDNATDFAAITYGAIGGNGIVPVPGTAPVTFAADTEVFSQELRAQGSMSDFLGAGSSLDWVIGYFYQTEDRDSDGGVVVSPEWLVSPVRPASGSQTVWAGQYLSKYSNHSVFADVTLGIIDSLKLSVGQRYSSQKLDSSRRDFGNVFAGASTPTGTTLFETQVKESGWTPRAAISFQPNKDLNIYATVSKGFRLGGSNPASNLSTTPCQAALRLLGITEPGTFKSDQVVSYEAGVKSSLADGRIKLSAAAYNIDWSDLQVSVNLTNYVSTCGASAVTNVGKARIRGLEGEFKALITDNLQLSLSGQYADAKMVEVAAGTAATKGDPLKDIPKFSATVGLQYSFPLPEGISATFRGDYAYVGRRSFNAVSGGINPAFMLPGYGLANLRATAERDGWEFSMFVDNLFNKSADLGVTLLPGGPGNYAGGYSLDGTQRYVATNRPRTMGIEVRRNF